MKMPQHLREVVGDGAQQEGNIGSEGQVKLDEQTLSREELDKKREGLGASQRIVEVKDGEYKTLNRMYS